MAPGMALRTDAVISQRQGGVVARDQHAESDGDRTELGRLQQQKPDQEIVPDQNELEHDNSGQAGLGDPEGSPPEAAQVAEVVTEGGVDDLVRQALEEGGHKEGAEGDADCGIDQDGADIGIDQVKSRQVRVDGLMIDCIGTSRHTTMAAKTAGRPRNGSVARA